ncbi:thioesterase family protein-like protein [Zopfochytrium polystomum]|nr:thioesterase family protein-like protein [Zopfochytrium polystomum]
MAATSSLFLRPFVMRQPTLSPLRARFNTTAAAGGASDPRDPAFYKFWTTVQTRWSDNDQYGHVNNSVYYHYFDSIVNTYLIANCSLRPPHTFPRGLVVTSHAAYHRPASFPETLHLGLAVEKIGTSSVAYRVGVFSVAENNVKVCCVSGGYTHVFVAEDGRPVKALPDEMRLGLESVRAITAKL